eukprot:scaffold354943_cov29-Attheya_sp.AAC.1
MVEYYLRLNEHPDSIKADTTALEKCPTMTKVAVRYAKPLGVDMAQDENNKYYLSKFWIKMSPQEKSEQEAIHDMMNK